VALNDAGVDIQILHKVNDHILLARVSITAALGAQTVSLDASVDDQTDHGEDQD
jgi:hypothetical protein